MEAVEAARGAATAPHPSFAVRALKPAAAATQVMLNPQLELSDLPVKSYYRYALPSFAPPVGGALGAPLPAAARFAALPGHKV